MILEQRAIFSVLLECKDPGTHSCLPSVPGINNQPGTSVTLIVFLGCNKDHGTQPSVPWVNTESGTLHFQRVKPRNGIALWLCKVSNWGV